MRIEMCGGIGAGKSSLAKLLLEAGYSVVFEEFKLNPFWKAFYSNPDKYNFETEVTFLLQHYHELKRRLEEANNVACDFSFLQDLAYAEMGLKGGQLDIFRSVYEVVIDELGKPDLLIHLKCSPAELVRRIKARGREEESLIDASFLNHLSSFIEAEVSDGGGKYSRLLIIDTEHVDFISSKEDQQSILSEIAQAVSSF